MASPTFPTKYSLLSPVSGIVTDDPGWMLDMPGEAPALLRAVYETKRFEPGPSRMGLFRFASWLPVKRMLKGSSAPVTYRSKGLAKALRLEHLLITFSGYWPERRGRMRTCSFKETEAYSVCARLDMTDGRTLVVASAGNTARAFARVCSDNKIPLLLCVPHDVIGSLWFDEPVGACVKLICTPPGSDYFDAIDLSNKICTVDGYVAEGGAKNVARRDGMGTTVLSAAAFARRIPDYYFQAVGSGTGAIAAWEAAMRLAGDGRFGDNTMKMVLSQNAPFVPMAEAWAAGSRELPPIDPATARRQIGEISAKVLSNRKPPYSLAGGLFDALTHTGGTIMPVTNEQAHQAAALFEATEGIDLHPAAAVATASLMECVRQKSIPPDALIMLNITGGGERRFRADHTLHYLKPFAIIGTEASREEVGGAIGEKD